MVTNYMIAIIINYDELLKNVHTCKHIMHTYIHAHVHTYIQNIAYVHASIHT